MEETPNAPQQKPAKNHGLHYKEEEEEEEEEEGMSDMATF
jgi:hypothetical protein